MGIVVGFIPWIVYWILVGNVPFTTAVTVAFAITLLIQLSLRLRGRPQRTLDIGNLAVFAVLMLAAYLVPDNVLERWLQPLSSLGLLLIAVGGVLVDRPFVREYAADSVDEATAKNQGFRTITLAMTWMWVGAFAVMFVSALIPPIVDGDATILDMDDRLSVVCYWVIPFTALGIAGAISAAFPPWFDRRSAIVDRRSASAASTTVRQQPAPPADIGGLTINAPADSRLDEPFGVSVVGGRAGSRVEVSATGLDLYGRRWRSRAEFTVPNTGLLDLSTAEPQSVDGQDPDWSTADGNAPVWAMRFDGDQTPEMFVPPAEPWQLTVQASGVGAVISTASGTSGRPVTGRRTVLRRTGAAGLRYESIMLGGLAGTLLLPAGRSPAEGWPGVACFGGSEGGFESQMSNAAVLASNGFATLAQAWISEPDAGESISRVPLERFSAALNRLAQHDEVDASQVSAMAISKGAEGLLAAVSARESALICVPWCWSARAACPGRRSEPPARCRTRSLGPGTAARFRGCRWPAAC